LSGGSRSITKAAPIGGLSRFCAFFKFLKTQTSSQRKISNENLVNNSSLNCTNGLISLPDLNCSEVVHGAFLVNKLCISIRCRFGDLSYDVHGSLKERSGQQDWKIELFVSMIIPGDWGKVGSGWLTRLL
jgi:hypothetical protein